MTEIIPVLAVNNALVRSSLEMMNAADDGMERIKRNADYINQLQ